jgi:hypothetical protein
VASGSPAVSGASPGGERSEARARERGVSLRVALNDALRAGLRPASGGNEPAGGYAARTSA